MDFHTCVSNGRYVPIASTGMRIETKDCKSSNVVAGLPGLAPNGVLKKRFHETTELFTMRHQRSTLPQKPWIHCRVVSFIQQYADTA